ncbi:MAG: hypothetical protein ACREHD_05895 [Pirellulales bacterium]
MLRPQFTLRSLLVAMLVVAAFFGGMPAQSQLDRPSITRVQPCFNSPAIVETMVTSDGKEWKRYDWNGGGPPAE